MQGIILAETSPLPFELAGVKVRVGGAPAPIFGIAEGPGYQQINIQIPQEAQFGSPGPLGTYPDVSVEVEQGGRMFRFSMLSLFTSPGEFFLWPPGTNFGIFQHAQD